ncbi:MAG: hypothetical protein COA69_09445 [Robiginitomaculum sp.]|nr:MAG: hypothetical protein COA69_09445 [Robiginitomaculum sp.]
MSNGTNEEANNQYVSHTEFATFAKETNRRFNEIMAGIDGLRDRTSRGTNWGSVFAGLAVLFALQTLYIQPVKEESQRLAQMQANQAESCSDNNRDIARLDERSKFIQLKVFGEPISGLQGD